MRLFEGTQFDRPPRCERCDELEENCECEPEPEPRTPPEKQRAKVFVEKRKGGRFITVVKNLLDEGDHLPELLTQLKNSCGAGGTIKSGQLEIQGDQAERIRNELTKLGYRIAK